MDAYIITDDMVRVRILVGVQNYKYSSGLWRKNRKSGVFYKSVIVEVLRHSYSGYYTSLPCWGRESDSPMPLKIWWLWPRGLGATLWMLFTSVRIRPVTLKLKLWKKTLRFFKDEIWESRIVAIARDCKSLAFRLQRFESSLSHRPLTMLLKGVTDAQRLRIVEVFRQGFLGLFEMNKSWIYGGVVECRHSRLRIWCQ